MQKQEYEKRFLSQHNVVFAGSKSPKKPGVTGRSPQTTPTKTRPAADRFIPVRQTTEDFSVRFSSLRNDDAPRNLPPNLQLDASNSQASNSGNAQGVRLNSSNGLGRGLRPGDLFFGPGLHPEVAASSSSSANATNAAVVPASIVLPEETGRQEMAAHRALLDNELLRANIEDLRAAVGSSNASNNGKPSAKPGMQTPPAKTGEHHDYSASRTSLFQYQTKQTPTKRVLNFDDPCPSTSSLGASPESPAAKALLQASDLGGVAWVLAPHHSTAPASPYALSPLSTNSQRLLRSPRKPSRKIPRNPYKVLDAPDLQDDFYLNLIDWSGQNTLSVGLGSCVYLWSACNSQVTKLCDLQTEGDLVTSVQWSDKGDLLAVGTNKGLLQIWDVGSQTRLHNISGHTSRIGCVAWNGDLVCSGSRDRHILQRDIRKNPDVTDRELIAHTQEVCGLKWSPDRQYLASGGNDNRLLIWSARGSASTPVQTYEEHIAAVKALAWSPHMHGLLVSGGGTADRHMRFWNTLTGQSMQSVDTGSQVCNIAWSKHSGELVSTHGYSQNQIVIWTYPSLRQVAKLTGHTYRVLYLAMSPDGESIVTGAGDETLRFWHVFSKQRSAKEARSKLNLFTSIR